MSPPKRPARSRTSAPNHASPPASTPKRTAPPRDPIGRLRRICLALPEAIEKIAWTEPTFRAGANGKIFVQVSNNHHNDGVVGAWVHAPPGAQDVLVRGDPDRFYVPPYVGHLGWVGVRLDREQDWDVIAELVEDAYRGVAKKRLLALLDARPQAPETRTRLLDARPSGA